MITIWMSAEILEKSESSYQMKVPRTYCTYSSTIFLRGRYYFMILYVHVVQASNLVTKHIINHIKYKMLLFPLLMMFSLGTSLSKNRYLPGIRGEYLYCTYSIFRTHTYSMNWMRVSQKEQNATHRSLQAGFLKLDRNSPSWRSYWNANLETSKLALVNTTLPATVHAEFIDPAYTYWPSLHYTP
jgi:hypothetical protein